MSTEEQIANLIEDFEDFDEDLRENAKKELIAIGEPAIPQLIETLAHNLYEVADQAAEVLATIGEPVIPILMDELEDAERHYGYAITSTLTRIGEPAIPVLLKAATNRVNEDLREFAVRALSGMGGKGNKCHSNAYSSFVRPC